jgi:hypothetical protein
MKNKLNRIRYIIRHCLYKLTGGKFPAHYITGPTFSGLTERTGGIALDEEDETV